MFRDVVYFTYKDRVLFNAIEIEGVVTSKKDHPYPAIAFLLTYNCTKPILSASRSRLLSKKGRDRAYE